MIGRVCYGLTIVCIIALACLPVLAHNAPSGWAYDPTCCSGYDCAPAPAGSVKATPEGWRVIIQPGEHPMVEGVPLDEVVPFNDPRILLSGDDQFHACVSGYRQAILCLYVPEGQFGT